MKTITVGIALLMVAALCEGHQKSKESNEKESSEFPEKELIKKLLEHYQKDGIDGRPVHKAKKAIDVKFSCFLEEIYDENKDDTLTIGTLMNIKWHDPQLKWNPKEHGGVHIISIPVERIWRPDLFSFNDFHTRMADQLTDFNAVHVWAFPSGDVVWNPSQTYRVRCNVTSCGDDCVNKDCLLSYGSWTYLVPNLDLQFDNKVADFDMSQYAPTPSIHLISHFAERTKHLINSPTNKSPYWVLNYHLSVKVKKSDSDSSDDNKSVKVRKNDSGNSDKSGKSDNSDSSDSN